MAEPATGLTPAPAGGQPPFSFAAAPVRPQFDPLELLPPAAQERLRQLRERSADAHRLTVPYEDIRQASMSRIEAENAVKRLLATAGEGGFNLREGDSRVTRERQRLEKAQDEFERLQTRQAERAAAWNAASLAQANVETWLRDGRPSGTVLADAEIEPPQLLKGEKDLLAAVENRRRRVRELRADLHRIESAPFPSAWAKAQMREQVEALAARGEPDVSALVERGANIVWPTTQVQVTVYNAQPGAVGYTETPDTLALTCWLHRDALIKRLDAEIDSESDDKAALTPEAREQQEAVLMGDLLACERDESALVWSAQSQSLPVEHRADCSPIAILGCRLVTVPRADVSGTSPTHAFDISYGGR